jgi:peptidoglycan/LPS O-acetylase OafA/YrhL
MRVALVLAWLALIGTLIVTESLMHSSYGQLAIWGTLSTAVIAVPIAVIRLTSAFRLNPKAAWLTLGLSVLTALLFMVPFIVWSQNGIPDYAAAVAYALVLVAVMCLASYRYLRRYALISTNLTEA